MQKSFAFNSDLINGEYDREYDVTELLEYFADLFSCGISPFVANNLQVIANDDMTVTLRPGILWDTNGCKYKNTDNLVMRLSPADGVRDRIDRISITWKNSEREMACTVQQGDYAYNPTAPECRRTANYRDYVVADVHVKAGAIRITQSDITDQRLNSDVCGMAAGLLQQIDTKEIFIQFKAWFDETTLDVRKKFVEMVEEYKAWKESFTETQENTFGLMNTTYNTEMTAFKENAIEEFNGWFTGNTNNWTEEFFDWFNNLKEQVTENAVVNLQNQIGNLTELETEDKSSLTGAVNEVAGRLQDEVEDTQIKIDNIGVFHMEATASYANDCYTITPTSINSKSPSEYVKKIGDIIVVEIMKNTSSANGTNKVYQTRIKNLNSGTTEKIYATNANNNDAVYEAMTNLDGCPILFLAIRKRPNSGELIYTLLNEPTFKPLSTYQYLDYVDNPSLRPFSVEGANKLWNNTIKCVETGKFTNDTISLELRFDATYLLITRELTISTGKVYGYRVRMYATPTDSNGAVAPSAANLAASSNAGVTLGTIQGYAANSHYGISLKASATYEVSYSLYELKNSYGEYPTDSGKEPGYDTIL